VPINGNESSLGERSHMPFTAHDLRYHADQSYPELYEYLLHRAKRYLGSLRFNAVELDIVVEHVIEQLVRLGVLGGGDRTPENALDHMSQAQFYSFLNHSIRNKAIDRLRKHRLSISTFAELESPSDDEGDDDPLNDIVEPIWGVPFATPEEATIQLVSQEELRSLLKHCIEKLIDAPHQLQAVIQELGAIEATDLLNVLLKELGKDNPATKTDTPLSNASQHKDHAHKKIRHCLQKSSTNLAVMIALRLTEYVGAGVGVRMGRGASLRPGSSHDVLVDVKTLTGDDLSEREVELGLKHLVDRGILDWHGESHIRLTNAGIKRLARFYEA
jgi:DNA-directed RNA polymerase specialized sigma24 family protein